MSIAFGRLLESLPVHVEAKILSPENPPAALSLSNGVESGNAVLRQVSTGRGGR
jgi:hypothetical protein